MATYNNKPAAAALRERLLSGKTWAEAAADKIDKVTSEDASDITREPVFLPVSAFASGIFAPLASLDVGQVSEVFPISSDDFAVGMKVEHLPESVRSYDSVSADIRLIIREQETRQRLSGFQKELMDKAQIVIYDTSLFPQRTAQPNDAETVNSDPSAEPVPSSEPAKKTD
jgi:foldase protein PrsA